MNIDLPGPVFSLYLHKGEIVGSIFTKQIIMFKSMETTRALESYAKRCLSNDK